MALGFPCVSCETGDVFIHSSITDSIQTHIGFPTFAIEQIVHLHAVLNRISAQSHPVHDLGHTPPTLMMSKTEFKAAIGIASFTRPEQTHIIERTANRTNPHPVSLQTRSSAISPAAIIAPIDAIHLAGRSISNFFQAPKTIRRFSCSCGRKPSKCLGELICAK